MTIHKYHCCFHLRNPHGDTLLATGWMDRGSNPSRGEIFRTRPDQPWEPSILLYTGYRFYFTEVKRPERGVYHPPHLAPRLKKEYSYTSTSLLGLRGLLYGELYLYLYKTKMTGVFE